MKTIGIVGTRRRDTEQDFIQVKNKFIELYEPDDKICSGLCPQGADWFAVLIALGMDYIHREFLRKSLYYSVKNKSKDLQYLIEPIWYPADWNKFGKGAGFIRNTDIAKTSDILIACTASDRKGGTEDTINKFLKIHHNGIDRLCLI